MTHDGASFSPTRTPVRIVALCPLSANTGTLGLPFTEDFSGANLWNTTQTRANGSGQEDTWFLAFKKVRRRLFAVEHKQRSGASPCLRPVTRGRTARYV